MSFVEIHGDICHDLLNSFAPAQLMNGPDGSVHAYPVVEPTVGSADELSALISYGCGCRATAATGVHDASSRTHAILRIYIQRHNDTVDGGGNEGVLTLVDLAGSEHRIDSMYHNADRRKEGANINASLMALKDCIRAKAAGKNASHQYRKSKLTMALKSSFLMPSSRTLVIATVSPSSKDTEHSLNTLRHACIMDGQEPSGDGETRFVTGGKVTKVQVGEINVAEISRKNTALKKAGHTIEAKTSNGNVSSREGGGPESAAPETSEKDKARMKRAAERKAFSKLTVEQRGVLMQARQRLGNDATQQGRLRRFPAVTAECDDELGSGVGGAAGGAREEVSFPRYGGILAVAQSPPAADRKKRYDEGPPTMSSLPTASAHRGVVDADTSASAKPSFQKLQASVYSSVGSVPEPLLRRQLKTLLKLNGYEASDIDRLIPPSPTEKIMSRLQQQSVHSPGTSGRTADDRASHGSPLLPQGGGRASSMRGGRAQSAAERPPSQGGGEGESGASPSNPPRQPARRVTLAAASPDKLVTSSRPASGRRSSADTAGCRDRQEQEREKELGRVRAEVMAAAAVEDQALQRQSRQDRAKAVRAKLEEDKRAAILAKKPNATPAAAVVRDVGDAHSGAEGSVTGDEGSYYVPVDMRARTGIHRAEIARLEAELAVAEGGGNKVSSAAVHGLKRQLQSHRGVLLREQRQVERRRVDSERPSEDPRPSSGGQRGPLVSSQSAPALMDESERTVGAGDQLRRPSAVPAVHDSDAALGLELYRRAVGFYRGNSGNSGADAAATNPSAYHSHAPVQERGPSPSKLSRIKAAPRIRSRHGSATHAYTAGGLSAQGGGQGYQERPKWHDVAPVSAPSAAASTAIHSGRDCDADNKYFLGLSEGFAATPSPPKPPALSSPAVPGSDSTRHFYGKRAFHEHVGAASAPWANDLTWHRNPNEDSID